MKKIIIINGSPRRRGATGKLLQEAARHLAGKGDTVVEQVELGELPMRPCRGCTACYRTGHCVICDDGVEELAARAKAADGIAIGSPTYGSNVSGQLKTFMDRGHFIVEQALHGKQCFALATYEIADGASTLAILEKFFLVAGGARRGKLCAKVRVGSDPLADGKLVRRLHRELDRFHDGIRRQARRSLFERAFDDLLVVRTIWRPHFRRFPERYEGVLRLYEEHGIHKACWPGALGRDRSSSEAGR